VAVFRRDKQQAAKDRVVPRMPPGCEPPPLRWPLGQSSPVGKPVAWAPDNQGAGFKWSRTFYRQAIPAYP